MGLNEVVAKIIITPSKSAQNKVDITVDMPFWLRKSEEDGKTYIRLALLGGMETFAENESEVDDAIIEALKTFFSAAQTYGKGIRKELSLLGWQQKKNSIRYRIQRKSTHRQHPASFVPSSLLNNSPLFHGVMQTGAPKALSLQV